MELTPRTKHFPAHTVIEALRAEGVSDEDIGTALDFQEAQRRAGAPVFPLRVICGLETAERRSGQLSQARILAVKPEPKRRKGGLHITRNPVWAQSVQTGSAEEAEFAAPLNARMRGRLVIAGKRVLKMGRVLARAARAGERTLTPDEEKLAGYTPSCQQILIELLDNEQYRKGWCIPSYEAIVGWTGLSRSTVYRSLRALANIGLIEWIRRFVYARDAEIGARSTQTSNLYRFRLPEWLAKLVGLFTPLPADDEERRADATRDHARMLMGAPSSGRRRRVACDTMRQPTPISSGEQRDSPDRGMGNTQECHGDLPPLHKDSFFKGDENGMGLVGPCAVP